MRVFLAICGNFFFAELPIERTVEDIGNIFGSTRLAVLVSIGHLLCGRLIEEECNQTRDNWQVLESFPWPAVFIVSRFVAIGKGTAIQLLISSSIAATRVDTAVDVFRAQP